MQSAHRYVIDPAPSFAILVMLVANSEWISVQMTYAISEVESHRDKGGVPRVETPVFFMMYSTVTFARSVSCGFLLQRYKRDRGEALGGGRRQEFARHRTDRFLGDHAVARAVSLDADLDGCVEE